MQAVAYVPRSGLSFLRRVFSTTQPHHQNLSSATSQWHDSTVPKIFQKGKGLVPFHEVILRHKFYSTNASATVQIPKETQSARDKEENPKSQALNSSYKAIQSLRKKELDREIWKVLQKGDNDLEETLNKTLDKLCFQLSHQHVILVLPKIKSPILALRFFRWATSQPRFTHNRSTYDAIVNILGHSKDFKTLHMVLLERLDARCDLSSRTFTFATAWHDDFNMLNEVIGIIEKIGIVHAYDMLITTLCKRHYTNAALRVLEKMVMAGYAPRISTFRPFILSYRRRNQMDMVQGIHETMKIFRVPIKSSMEMKARDLELSDD